MSITTCTTCTTCGHDHHWSWEEAFDKFGFGDGDGMAMTAHVVAALSVAGYTVEARPWGVHNVTIDTLAQDGVDLIPKDTRLGYDDPRDYLPKTVVELLDATFPSHGRIER